MFSLAPPPKSGGKAEAPWPHEERRSCLVIDLLQRGAGFTDRHDRRSVTPALRQFASVRQASGSLIASRLGARTVRQARSSLRASCAHFDGCCKRGDDGGALRLEDRLLISAWSSAVGSSTASTS